jgi:hypothetical protein
MINFNRYVHIIMNIDGYMVDDVDGSWCWDTFISLIFIYLYDMWDFIWERNYKKDVGWKMMLPPKEVDG